MGDKVSLVNDMAELKKVHPVKLICGILTGEESLITESQKLLSHYFGSIDYKSRILDFNSTDYYAKEMGTPLLRCFFSFKKLIHPAKLAKIKLITNKLEKKVSSCSKAGKRIVNIDPGYMHPAKLVLASAKNFSHRIYIGRQIYAETTLIYKGGAFRVLEWTYPDYKTKDYLEIMESIRKILVSQTSR
ncbi:MAG: DUF4416 family protein [Candidatus Omnitrophota bacterium]